MGIVQKVNDWWTEKSDHIARGGDANRTAAGAYYASSEAEQAYGGMRMPAQNTSATADTQSAGGATGRSAPADRFSGDTADKYSGRVPYRSQKDMQAEAEAQRQQMEDQARRQQNAGQQKNAQPFARPSGQPVYQQPQPAQQPANVLQFPGMIRGPEGNLYAHVEYVVLLRSRNECTKVIEYIKANASVFLNMEFIANDSERQRCVDMLSGAAYTLGCHLNKISQRGIYLISSPSVCVVIDPAMQKYASAPETQGYVRPEYAAYQTGYGAGAQPSPYAAQPQTAYAGGERAAVPQPAGYGAGATGYGARASGYRTQAATSAGYGAQPASAAGYGAQPASVGGYGAQPASVGGYGTQSVSTAGYGAQSTSAAGYGAQRATGTGNGAQPTSAVGYGSQTAPYAAQLATAVGYGNQTAPYAAQRPAYGAGSPSMNPSSPTGGYAAAATQTQARRATAPFAMQGAFTRSADSGAARP